MGYARVKAQGIAKDRLLGILPETEQEAEEVVPCRHMDDSFGG